MKLTIYTRMIMSIIILHGMAYAGSSFNQLQKVFHHQATIPKKVAAARVIELGSIVFYFSQKPVINNLSGMPSKDSKEGVQELVIFFPKAQLAGDGVKQMIQAINAIDSTLYKPTLKIVKKPIDGLQFKIAYDPKKVGIKYDFFDFIGAQRPQPGVSFQFYDQELINDLSCKTNRAVLHNACAGKHSQVIIDCGHGGTDTGAMSLSQLKEKDVALAVGLDVASQLKKKGYQVTLTRDKDFFVALDERTTRANTLDNPGLFLSIHANASINKNDAGVETYFLEPSLLSWGNSSLSTADLQLVHQQAISRRNQSKLLAQLTHKHLIKEVNKINPSVIDRSIRHTVLQVLMGTTMPSALIEIGFLSNIDEAKLLANKKYQHSIAQGICNGIVSYFNITKAL